jgi:diaminopimelate decarboxylase
MTEPLMRTMIAAFDVVDGQLAVGGVPLERLTARVGSTPFFAYDRRLLTARVAHLRETLPPGIELGYAMKANPMPAVVQHLARLVDSIDVASALEMRTALDTPMPARQITFAGPGKTEEEIRQAVAADVLIEMESRTEVQRVLRAGERLGVTPRVALRVNPNFVVKGSGMRMGGGPQQFGVDAEEVPALLSELASTGLDFIGFHVFAGSQNLHADILCEAQRQTVDLVLELALKAPSPITYLNLGGGFGIPYFDKDEPLDLAPIAENLHQLLTEQIEPQLPDVHIRLELGRYLVGEAGVYVTRVVDCKDSRGQLYVVVDGGLHHQLAASGNLGQVIRRNYPIALGNRMDEPPDTTTTVVGCLCTPLDLLGDKVKLPNPRVGDLVVLFQAGAYGLTASPTAFLGHPAPVELLL